MGEVRVKAQLRNIFEHNKYYYLNKVNNYGSFTKSCELE